MKLKYLFLYIIVSLGFQISFTELFWSQTNGMTLSYVLYIYYEGTDDKNGVNHYKYFVP